MEKYSPYHKIIPERLELLENIGLLLGAKATIHYNVLYAKRKLPIISYVINPRIKDTIMITAGCHGNEPAPIYAIHNFLKKKLRINNKRIVIVPCIVPMGFCTHIDRNGLGVDINRDFFSKNPQRETKLLKQLVKKYKPEFVLNLHEDPDEEMFYVYLEGKEYREKAEQIISLVSKDMNFYKRKKIHEDVAINGIIEPKPSTSFEDYLIKLNIPNFCIETPGLYSLQERIRVHEKILKFVVNW